MGIGSSAWASRIFTVKGHTLYCGLAHGSHVCYLYSVLPLPCVTFTVCYLYRVLPLQCVTFTVCYLYRVLPLQCVTFIVCYLYSVLPL